VFAERDQAVSNACLKVFGETLTNGPRHGDGTRIDIRQGFINEDIVLTIANDGGLDIDGSAIREELRIPAFLQKPFTSAQLLDETGSVVMNA